MKSRELVVIARKSDLFASKFVEFARSEGATAYLLDFDVAASVFTVEVQHEGISKVTPQCGILCRDVPRPALGGFDEEFMAGEVYAQVWSALALTTAPVINRPNECGLFAHYSEIASVTEKKATTRSRTEIFVSDARSLPASLASWWAEGSGDAIINLVALFEGKVTPLRVRPGVAMSRYMRCTVLDEVGYMDATQQEDTWCVAESIRVVGKIGLRFAEVTWMVDGGDPQSRYLVNVSPAPGLRGSEQMQISIFEHLLRVLQ